MPTQVRHECDVVICTVFRKLFIICSFSNYFRITHLTIHNGWVTNKIEGVVMFKNIPEPPLHPDDTDP